MSKSQQSDGLSRKRKYLVAFSTLIGTVGTYRRQLVRIRAKSPKKAIRRCRSKYRSALFVEVLA